jgi:hypothetical protein
LLEWSETCEDVLWIKIRFAWRRPLKGRHAPVLRRLVGNERTVIELSSAPGNVDASSLSDRLYTDDFKLLTGSLPFTVCLRGVVTSVTQEIISHAGNPMKNFKLHDNTGRYVQCVLCGRHVDNSGIVELNEVILYFATAMSGLNDSPGQLWMYDQSHIVALGVRICVPPPRICMDFH